MSTTSTEHNVEPVALRVNDAARAAGIGRTSLYELISEGKLRTVKVAGRRLVPLSELKRLFDHAV